MKGILVVITAVGLAAPAFGAMSGRGREAGNASSVAPFTVEARSVDGDAALAAARRGEPIRGTSSRGFVALLVEDTDTPTDLTRPKGFMVELVTEDADANDQNGGPTGARGLTVELDGAPQGAVINPGADKVAPTRNGSRSRK